MDRDTSKPDLAPGVPTQPAYSAGLKHQERMAGWSAEDHFAAAMYFLVESGSPMSHPPLKRSTDAALATMHTVMADFLIRHGSDSRGWGS